MAPSLSSLITFHVVFTLTDFKVFVYFSRNICFPKPVHLIKCYIMQSMSLETIISAHTALIHVHCCFEAKSSVAVPHSLHPSLPLLLSFPPSCFFLYTSFFTLCYPLHLTNSSLSPYFLSGAFADRVQLPDDDGTSAEGEPQCDGGRSLHAS